MNKILGSFFLSIGFLVAGSITATVDSAEVIAGDSVMLTLAVTGKDSAVIPDIKEINGEKVFNIQRRSSSNFVYVNGKSSMETTQILMLEFKPKSDVTIPSFSVKVDGKVEETNAIKITLLKSSAGLKRETKDFSLDMKMDKTKFYLGESMVLNVYFKQRTNLDILQIEYTPPKFKDFFSKQIGDGKTYRKGEFTIQELNYLLIAKKAGKLTLEPARAKVAERSRQRQRGGWFIDVPKWTKISSPAMTIEVIEPSEAHDLVGKYRLSDKVDHLKVKANKPVILRIELLGIGNLDDYDGISFDMPSVTMYSDDAKIESKLMGKNLQSRYQKSFVFISDHNFTIPSKDIRVYDYGTGKVKVLKTKEYHIEVEAGKQVVSSPSVQTQTPVQVAPRVSGSIEPWYQKLPSLLALLLAFILGVLATLALKYIPDFVLPKWRKQKSFNGESALKVLYPKIGESKEVEEMVRKLYAVKSGEKGVEIDRKRLKVLVERYS
jgi:hypothetical protein